MKRRKRRIKEIKVKGRMESCKETMCVMRREGEKEASGRR